ncbi:U3 small nucleolar RNA-associated protein 4-like [Holothuria leucospilota]|uniref:U3 small nucleolar RNA-associated protein 4-like n=1 Tax=Holothuria leucospilota TaxID=206669 RepID=A0A9Q1CBN1_HOLLE|nr:U3 small nucleolar RNA-associated protein 4-like [Holothuria leucospilota]
MPSGIQCIAHDHHNQYLAVGRNDSSIDLWKTGSNWYHQKVSRPKAGPHSLDRPDCVLTAMYQKSNQTIPGSEQRNVNSLAWVKGRLFSAGLQGNITEYDLVKLSPKVSNL